MQRDFLMLLLHVLTKLASWVYGIKIPVKVDKFGFSEVIVAGQKIKGDIREMFLKEGEKVTATVNPTTISNHPGTFEAGSAVWTVDDETKVKVTPNAANELQAEFECIDGTNPADITAKCVLDGDPDPGDDQRRPLEFTGVISVSQGESFGGSLTFGEVVQPTAPSA